MPVSSSTTGVDWRAVEDAREYNDRHGGTPRRGGSTITMQCARNVFLWPGKSYLRKTLEVALAYAIELAWDKRRILEVCLNVIEWGPGIYGAEAAARASFDTSAATLDARQAALMAAVLLEAETIARGKPISVEALVGLPAPAASSPNPQRGRRAVSPRT